MIFFVMGLTAIFKYFNCFNLSMAPTLTDIEYSDKRYDGWRQAQKSVTFAGTVSGGIGDIDKANNPFTIFTVTGDVKVKVVGICTTTLSGAASVIEIGVSNNLSGILVQTTAEDIDVNEIWHDASPDSGVEASTVMSEKIVANGLDIIGTVLTANLSAGVVKFDCLWKPLSTDGNVVSA